MVPRPPHPKKETAATRRPSDVRFVENDEATISERPHRVVGQITPPMVSASAEQLILRTSLGRCKPKQHKGSEKFKN